MRSYYLDTSALVKRYALEAGTSWIEQNLKEVVELCLEEYEGPTGDLPRFVGLQQIEIAG